MTQRLNYMTDDEIDSLPLTMSRNDKPFLICLMLYSSDDKLSENLFIANDLSLKPLSFYTDPTQALLINFVDNSIVSNHGVAFNTISVTGNVFQQRIMPISNNLYQFGIESFNSSRFYLYEGINSDYSYITLDGIVKTPTAYFSSRYKLLFQTLNISSGFVSYDKSPTNYDFFFLPNNYRWSGITIPEKITPTPTVFDPELTGKRLQMINVSLVIVIFTFVILVIFFILLMFYKYK